MENSNILSPDQKNGLIFYFENHNKYLPKELLTGIANQHQKHFKFLNSLSRSCHGFYAATKDLLAHLKKEIEDAQNSIEALLEPIMQKKNINFETFKTTMADFDKAYGLAMTNNQKRLVINKALEHIQRADDYFMRYLGTFSNLPENDSVFYIYHANQYFLWHIHQFELNIDSMNTAFQTNPDKTDEVKSKLMLKTQELIKKTKESIKKSKIQSLKNEPLENNYYQKLKQLINEFSDSTKSSNQHNKKGCVIG